jgi:hypothetical protein
MTTGPSFVQRQKPGNANASLALVGNLCRCATANCARRDCRLRSIQTRVPVEVVPVSSAIPAAGMNLGDFFQAADKLVAEHLPSTRRSSILRCS